MKLASNTELSQRPLVADNVNKRLLLSILLQVSMCTCAGQKVVMLRVICPCLQDGASTTQAWMQLEIKCLSKALVFNFP